MKTLTKLQENSNKDYLTKPRGLPPETAAGSGPRNDSPQRRPRSFAAPAPPFPPRAPASTTRNGLLLPSIFTDRRTESPSTPTLSFAVAAPEKNSSTRPITGWTVVRSPYYGTEGNGTEGNGRERKGKERKGRERNGRERKGTEGKGRERNGTEGNGRERKGTEGGREGKFP